MLASLVAARIWSTTGAVMFSVAVADVAVAERSTIGAAGVPDVLV